MGSTLNVGNAFSMGNEFSMENKFSMGNEFYIGNKFSMGNEFNMGNTFSMGNTFTAPRKGNPLDSFLPDQNKKGIKPDWFIWDSLSVSSSAEQRYSCVHW